MSDILLSAFIITALALLYLLSSQFIRKYIAKKLLGADLIPIVMKLWKIAFISVVMFTSISSLLSKSLQTMGLSLAVLGSMLSWMLAAPITNLAGWLFLVLKSPFKLGQRIIIAGITGDVLDISPMYTTLNQVGGTIPGEERSGRGTLIPNSYLFNQILTNYSIKLPTDQQTGGVKYVLDEVAVRITYESDWQEAARILVESAKTITSEAIAVIEETSETSETPYIRAEFFESGLLMRVRYKVEATKRQETWTQIYHMVFNEIQASNKVFFCFNHSEVMFHYTPHIPHIPYPPQHPIWFERLEKGDNMII